MTVNLEASKKILGNATLDQNVSNLNIQSKIDKLRTEINLNCVLFLVCTMA